MADEPTDRAAGLVDRLDAEDEDRGIVEQQESEYGGFDQDALAEVPAMVMALDARGRILDGQTDVARRERHSFRFVAPPGEGEGVIRAREQVGVGIVAVGVEGRAARALAQREVSRQSDTAVLLHESDLELVHRGGEVHPDVVAVVEVVLAVLGIAVLEHGVGDVGIAGGVVVPDRRVGGGGAAAAPGRQRETA